MSGSENDDGSGDAGPGTREVAHRLFAAEFEDADFSYSESDEERAPNYVVVPTGARVNRLFAVGVLTEVAQAGENILRARVVDPSGAFVAYAGQYQPEAMAFFERQEPPAFVALTGKARTFQPEDSDRVFTSVRPESVNAVEADSRDRWVLNAAERTLERIGVVAWALDAGLEGEDLRAALREAGVDASLAAGVPLALEHYGTSRAYLAALQDLALDAIRQVAGDVEEVAGLDVAPDAAGGEGFTPVRPLEPEGEGAAGEPGTETAEEPAEPAAGDEAETGTTADSGVEAVESDAGEAAGAGAAESPSTTEPTAGGADEEPASEPATGTNVGDAGGTGGSEPVESVDATATDDADGTAGTVESGADGGPGTEDVDAGVEPAAESDAGADAAEEPEPSLGAGGGDALDDLGDFESGGIDDEADDEFDDVLDEETREEVEAEFGTEFETGTEVAPAGEADIEPEAGAIEPEADEPVDEEPVDDEPVDDEPITASGAASGGGEPEAEPESEPESAGAEEADLETVLMEEMEALDDGDGAPRAELVTRVQDRTGVSEADVDGAIEEALMSGQCYEPTDDRLKPI